MAASDDTRECYVGRSIMLREGAFSVEHTKQKITTFLMFDGKAEEAMNYYVSVFDQAEIVSIQGMEPTKLVLRGPWYMLPFH